MRNYGLIGQGIYSFEKNFRQKSSSTEGLEGEQV